VDLLAPAAASVAAAGLINSPLHWLRGLLLIIRGIGHLRAKDVKGVEDIIEGVLIIIREEPAGLNQ
jgi:hypothetical protein